jgi:hypothetical protein
MNLRLIDQVVSDHLTTASATTTAAAVSGISVPQSNNHGQPVDPKVFQPVYRAARFFVEAANKRFAEPRTQYQLEDLKFRSVSGAGIGARSAVLSADVEYRPLEQAIKVQAHTSMFGRVPELSCSAGRFCWRIEASTGQGSKTVGYRVSVSGFPTDICRRIEKENSYLLAGYTDKNLDPAKQVQVLSTTILTTKALVDRLSSAAILTNIFRREKSDQLSVSTVAASPDQYPPGSRILPYNENLRYKNLILPTLEACDAEFREALKYVPETVIGRLKAVAASNHIQTLTPYRFRDDLRQAGNPTFSLISSDRPTVYEVRSSVLGGHLQFNGQVTAGHMTITAHGFEGSMIRDLTGIGIPVKNRESAVLAVASCWDATSQRLIGYGPVLFEHLYRSCVANR